MSFFARQISIYIPIWVMKMKIIMKNSISSQENRPEAQQSSTSLYKEEFHVHSVRLWIKDFWVFGHMAPCVIGSKCMKKDLKEVEDDK